MSAIFHDLQELDNPLNGTAVDSAFDVSELLWLLRSREPFLFELRGETGFTLTVGFAGDCGCVQYARSEGSPPYEVAVAESLSEAGGQPVRFLAGNQLTEIPRRLCIPIEKVADIASQFVTCGGRAEMTGWEEI